PVNWAYPRTVEGFLHLVTRGQYERPRPTGELGTFFVQLWFLAMQTCKDFGWFYLVPAVLPVFFLRHLGAFVRTWVLGSVAVLVCVGPLMVEFLNPSSDLATLQLISPYFGAMNVVLALWTGLGLVAIGSMVAKPRASDKPVNGIF